jgi:hypothetical protein
MRLGRVEQVIRAMDFGVIGGMEGVSGGEMVLACWGRVLGMWSAIWEKRSCFVGTQYGGFALNVLYIGCNRRV